MTAGAALKQAGFARLLFAAAQKLIDLGEGKHGRRDVDEAAGKDLERAGLPG